MIYVDLFHHLTALIHRFSVMEVLIIFSNSLFMENMEIYRPSIVMGYPLTRICNFDLATFHICSHFAIHFFINYYYHYTYTIYDIIK